MGCSFKNSSLGRVRPALLQELQEQPWCPHQGCQACAGSDHHQAHHEDGRSQRDRDYTGELAVFEREMSPFHRGATGTKTGKRDQEQIPKT